MSLTFACLLGFAVYLGSRRWRSSFALLRAWRLERARPRAPSQGDLPLLVDLTGLGLSAGMTFPAAVEAAADQVGGPIAGEVGDTVRRRTSGVTGEFVGSGITTGLFAVVDRALVTGAPMLPAVTGYGEALHADERHLRTARARRLPVKLLFPLALLILPGFLVLTVGPALLAGLQRMGL